jgi:hypothetical protein
MLRQTWGAKRRSIRRRGVSSDRCPELLRFAAGDQGWAASGTTLTIGRRRKAAAPCIATILDQIDPTRAFAARSRPPTRPPYVMSSGGRGRGRPTKRRESIDVEPDLRSANARIL